MLDLPCVIFAGGKSSRMGTDKALLPFGGYTTLAEYQYKKASAIFNKVYISCKTRKKFCFDADFIEDEDEVYSPRSAFLTIFNKLDADRFFVMSVDTPFVSKEVCQKLDSEDKQNVDATVAILADQLQPLCGIYHRSMQEMFFSSKQKKNHKLTRLLQQADTQAIGFDDPKLFLNLNYPEQYQEALKIVNTNLL